MGEKTGISWTDSSWNCLRGCSRVSEGCRNCYAEAIAARFSDKGMPYHGLARRVLKMDGASKPRWTGEIKFVQEHLMDPFRWRRPRRIFVNSMSDLFHEKVSDHVIDKVVAVMIVCRDHETRGGHTFQTLTKRPARMRTYLSDPTTLERVASAAANLMEDGDRWYDSIVARDGGLLDPKIWWGTSVEDQAAADERLPELVATPAAVRFVSCEPLLGPLDLTRALVGAVARRIYKENGGRDDIPIPAHLRPPTSVDWIIAGCESGHGSRPCEVEWLRSIRDQCGRAGVAFFLKQATQVDGAYTIADLRPVPQVLGRQGELIPVVGVGAGSKEKGRGVIELPYLDGVQHAAFPEVSS